MLFRACMLYLELLRMPLSGFSHGCSAYRGLCADGGDAWLCSRGR